MNRYENIPIHYVMNVKYNYKQLVELEYSFKVILKLVLSTQG